MQKLNTLRDYVDFCKNCCNLSQVTPFDGRAYIKIILKNHARSYFASRSYYRGNTVLLAFSSSSIFQYYCITGIFQYWHFPLTQAIVLESIFSVSCSLFQIMLLFRYYCTIMLVLAQFKVIMKSIVSVFSLLGIIHKPSITSIITSDF